MCGPRPSILASREITREGRSDQGKERLEEIDIALMKQLQSSPSWLMSKRSKSLCYEVSKEYFAHLAQSGRRGCVSGGDRSASREVGISLNLSRRARLESFSRVANQGMFSQHLRSEILSKARLGECCPGSFNNKCVQLQ